MTTPAAVAGEIVSGEGSIINEARAAAQYGRADEIAQLLDDNKLTPDAKDEDGCSLLQWAAINGRDNVVDVLERGADCNAIGGVLEENALQWACRQGRSSAPCCSEKAAATRRTEARRAARPCTSVVGTAKSAS